MQLIVIISAYVGDPQTVFKPLQPIREWDKRNPELCGKDIGEGCPWNWFWMDKMSDGCWLCVEKEIIDTGSGQTG